jgi:hypothetical protein
MTPFIIALAAAASVAMSSPPGWTIKKFTDQMTDKVDCVGCFRGDIRYQLNRNAFHIGVVGVPKGVTFRFGEKPPRSIRIVSDIERQIRAVSLEGSDFDELLSAGRLRYSVLTYGNSLVEDDLKLDGIHEALKTISGPACSR